MRSSFLIGLSLLLSLSFLACDSSGDDSSNPTPLAGAGDSSLQWDGEERRYQLYVPTTYDAARPAPLIVAFHGKAGNSKDMQRGTDLDELAEQQGTIVAYLDDLVGDWAEGCNCAQADALGVDDIGFAKAVTVEVGKTHNIDEDQLYAVGFSIGGLFAQRVACEATDVFAGVVSVGSTMSAPLAQNCAPGDPVDVMIILGSDDQAFPWSGTGSGVFSVLSVNSLTGEWVENNSCANTPVQSETTLGPFAVSTSIYATCEGGGSFTVHRIENGEHFWYPGTGGLIGDFIGGQWR